MKLEGIHHITAITEDAQRNVDFYAGCWACGWSRKPSTRTTRPSTTSSSPTRAATRAPTSPSSSTRAWLRGGPGPAWSTASSGASPPRTRSTSGRSGSPPTGSSPSARASSLRFSDPEGLDHELLVVDVPDPPLVADHPEIPAELALQGFHAVRAYSAAPEASAALLEALEFERVDGAWEARGEQRGGLYVFDEPPAERGLQGAGSVHHVAWASLPDEHMQWRDRAIAAGAQPTPEIDRFYFRSVYFREPSGVLFELATMGPGFTVDEPLEHLGEKLSLPPDYEHLRAEVEPNLRPVVNPRAD